MFEREKIEKDSLTKQLKEARFEAQKHIDELDRRNQALQVDNSSLSHQIKSADVSRVKVQDKDDRIRQLEMEVKHLEQKAKAVEGQNEKMQDGKIEVERRSEGLRR